MVDCTDEQIEAGARALAEHGGWAFDDLPIAEQINNREYARAVLTAAAEATQAETPATRCDHGCATVTAACLMDGEARIIKAETPEPAAEPVADSGIEVVVDGAARPHPGFRGDQRRHQEGTRLVTGQTNAERAETPMPLDRLRKGIDRVLSNYAEPVAYALYDRSKKGRVLFVSKHEVRESDYAYWRVVPLYAKGEGSE